MPDVLFEALVVAAMTVLLWPRPQNADSEGTAHGTRAGFVQLTCGAALLGLSVAVRQVGVLFVVPLLAYALTAAAPGWQSRRWRNRGIGAMTALAVFAVPVVGYMAFSQAVLGTGFRLSNMNDAYLYGRLAYAADCVTLKVPGYARPLCPAPSTAAETRRRRPVHRPVIGGLQLPASRGRQPERGHPKLRPGGAHPAAVPGRQRHRQRRDQGVRAHSGHQPRRPANSPLAVPRGLSRLPGSGRIGTRQDRQTAGNQTAGRRVTQLPTARRVHTRPTAARLPHRRSSRLRGEPPTPPGSGTRRTARYRARPDRSSRRRRVRVLLALPASPARHAAAGRRARRHRLPSASRNPPVRR